MHAHKRIYSYILLSIAGIMAIFLYSKLSMDNWYYQERKILNKKEALEAAKHSALFLDTDFASIDYKDGKKISLKGEKISISNNQHINVSDFLLEVYSTKFIKTTLNSENALYDNKNSTLTITSKAQIKRDGANLDTENIFLDLKNESAFSDKPYTYIETDLRISSTKGFKINRKEDYEFTLLGDCVFSSLKGEKIIFKSKDVNGFFSKEMGKLKFLHAKNKVEIHSNSYDAYAEEAELNGNTMILVLKNNLVIKNKDGNIEADSLEYDFKQGKTKIFGSKGKRVKVKIYDAGKYK